MLALAACVFYFNPDGKVSRHGGGHPARDASIMRIEVESRRQTLRTNLVRPLSPDAKSDKYRARRAEAEDGRACPVRGCGLHGLGEEEGIAGITALRPG